MCVYMFMLYYSMSILTGTVSMSTKIMEDIMLINLNFYVKKKHYKNVKPLHRWESIFHHKASLSKTIQ